MALAQQQDVLEVTEAGWYADPDRVHHLRYFDGTAWTSYVTHHGPAPCQGCWLDTADYRH